MTDDEFDRGIAVLIAGVGRPMSREQIEVWREIVSDLTFEQFKRGICSVLRDYKYAGFPPVGLIRQAAGASGGIIDPDAAALLAWQTVLRAMREHGGYRSIQWGDPAIPAAIDAIGESWGRLCEQSSQQLHAWTSKQFLAAYKSFRAAGITGKGVSAGLIAEDAGRLGFSQPEPVRLTELPKAIYGFGGHDGRPALPGPVDSLMPPNFGRLPHPELNQPERITDDEFERRRQRGVKQLARMAERYSAPRSLAGPS